MMELSEVRGIPPSSEFLLPKFDVSAETRSRNGNPLTNQDAYFISHRHNSFGVFDGVGSLKDSYEAASGSAKIIKEYLEFINPKMEPEKAKITLRTAHYLANQFIRTSQKEMDTTGTFGFITSTSKNHYYLTIANIGDSRVYSYRNGILLCETRDHNHLYDQCSSSHDFSTYDTIQTEIDNCTNHKKLTPNAKFFFNHRHEIGRTMGDENSTPDFSFLKIKSGDILLFTTDGIHDNLTTNQLESLVKKYENRSAHIIARKIIKQALSVSQGKTDRSKPDDITIVTIRCP